MVRRDPVGSIRWPSNSDFGDEDRYKFIQCVDRRKPQINEVWNFGEDGVTREVHPTTRVEVGAGLVSEFATDYFIES